MLFIILKSFDKLNNEIRYMLLIKEKLMKMKLMKIKIVNVVEFFFGNFNKCNKVKIYKIILLKKNKLRENIKLTQVYS